MQATTMTDNSFNFNLILDQKEQSTLLPQPEDEYPDDVLFSQEGLLCYSSRGSHNHNYDNFDFIVKDEFILAAVYDGHGGSSVSLYLKNNLLKNIQSHHQFQKNPAQSILQCIQNIQKQVTNQFQQTIGSTLLVVLWAKTHIIVANLGDGVCYGFQNCLLTDNPLIKHKESLKNYKKCNQYNKISLNQIHNLQNQDERNRIRGNGGSIFRIRNSYRVAGQLNISRSIGDKKYKKWISASPSIKTYDYNFEHLVLATDGFSKIMNSCANAKEIMNIAESIPYTKDNSTFILISRPVSFI